MHRVDEPVVAPRPGAGRTARGYNGSVRTPSPTLDIRDVQVIKDGRTFFQTNRYGDVPAGNAAALGLYHEDTRYLSRLELTLDRGWPILLHASTEQNYRQIVELAYPMAPLHPSRPEQRDSVSLHRSRVLSGALFERLRVRNYGIRGQDVQLSLRFDADFLDIFEVRGLERARRGQLQPPHVERNVVVLRDRGLDGVSRATNRPSASLVAVGWSRDSVRFTRSPPPS
jgi:glycogen debranching enzyme